MKKGEQDFDISVEFKILVFEIPKFKLKSFPILNNEILFRNKTAWFYITLLSMTNWKYQKASASLYNLFYFAKRSSRSKNDEFFIFLVKIHVGMIMNKMK